MASFESLGLMPELIVALQEQGWLLPRAVQDESIPLILGGSDVIIAANTGSGKTGAFGLPVVQLVYEHVKGYAQYARQAEEADKSIETVPIIHDTPINITDDDICTNTIPKQWAGCRSAWGVRKGKHCFSMEVLTDGGYCRAGFSMVNDKSSMLGLSKHSYGLGSTGVAVHDSKFIPCGDKLKKKSKVVCYIDLDDTFEVSFTVDGKKIDTNMIIPQIYRGQMFFPTICIKDCNVKVQFSNITLNNNMTSIMEGFEKIEQQQKNKYIMTPSAIVVEGTKELALQVFNEIRKFSKRLPENVVKPKLLQGGKKKDKNSEEHLKDGNILIANLESLYHSICVSNKIDTSKCKFFVLDEADSLSGGMRKLTAINNKLTDISCQRIICSATLDNSHMLSLGNSLCKEPQIIDLRGSNLIPDTVDHVLVYVNPMEDNTWNNEQHKNDNLWFKGENPYLKQPDLAKYTDGVNDTSKNEQEKLSYGTKILKLGYLMEIIRVFQPVQSIIFARTRLDCDCIQDFIQYCNSINTKDKTLPELSAVVVHSAINDEQRIKNLELFRDGKIRFLVCTDVEARGLDISGLPMVINFTLPAIPINYVHRVGRVGRNGQVGLAISLVSTEKERVWWHSNDCKVKKLDDKKQNHAYHKTHSLVQKCSVWFDEMELISQVESLLHRARVTVPVVDIYNLSNEKGELLRVLSNSRGHEQRDARMVEAVERMKPIAAELFQLEQQTEMMYHVYRQKVWIE